MITILCVDLLPRNKKAPPPVVLEDMSRKLLKTRFIHTSHCLLLLTNAELEGHIYMFHFSVPLKMMYSML